MGWYNAPMSIVAPRRLKIYFVVCILCCVRVAKSQTLPLVDDDAARIEFEKPGGFRDQIFTKCGELLYLGPMGGPVPILSQAKKYEALAEMTGAVGHFRAEGLKMTPAMKMNKITWQGGIWMSYTVLRTRHASDGIWGPWEPYKDFDKSWQVAKGVNQNGSWTWEVGPDLQSVSFLPLYTPDDLHHGVLSCVGILDNAPPHVSIAKPPASTPLVPGPPKDGFKYLTEIPLAEREYGGTPEGFAARLPGFLERAATASGLPMRDFRKEMAFIADAVRTCKQITPQMEASVKGWTGSLGPQYRVCSSIQYVSRQLRIAGAERGIILWVRPLTGGWAKGFTAEVSFDRLNEGSDTVIKQGVYDMKAMTAEKWSRYGIVRATFQ